MAAPTRRGTWPGVARRGHRVEHESPVQAAIVEFHGRCVTHPECAILYAVPNGEKRDKKTAGKLAGRGASAFQEHFTGGDYDYLNPSGLIPFGQGVLPGAPDLMLLLPGAIVVLIEVKDPGLAGIRRPGQLSKNQLRFEAAVLAMGHSYVRLESVDGYEALLRTFGVELRVAASSRPPAPVSLAP